MSAMTRDEALCCSWLATPFEIKETETSDDAKTLGRIRHHVPTNLPEVFWGSPAPSNFVRPSSYGD